jgi:mutator protein MutT
MLIRDGLVLAEKRKSTKTVAPGAIALPGGHVEDGEQSEQAAIRELQEELAITPERLTYVCTLLHRSSEFRRVSYFAVEGWYGEVSNHEAESLLWLDIGDLDRLDLDVDRIALKEYLRVFAQQPAAAT